ncbi:hypothetical protein SBY92_004916 [Candida maltosa Xu316]
MSSSNSSEDKPSVNEIQSSMVKEMSEMTVQQLTELEQQLSQEFKTFGKEFLESRLSRINTVLDKINNSIKSAVASDKSWQKIYNFESETINNIMTNTEDLILVDKGALKNKPDLVRSFDEYQEELKEIFKNLQSPFDFDGTFKNDNNEEFVLNNQQLSKLPFPLLFNNFFQKHRHGLNTVNKEKDYQTKLIQDNSYGNRVILWKQYYCKLNQQKQKLINETQEELNQLYKDYYRLNEHKNIGTSLNHYYRSLIHPYQTTTTTNNDINTINTQDVSTVLNYNHDSNYVDLDTRHKPKNKIELSDIRKRILGKDWELNNISQGIKRSLDGTESVADSKKICLGLSDYEAEQDLALMKSNIKESSTRQESSGVENVTDAEDTSARVEEDEAEEVDGDDEREEEEEDDDDEEQSAELTPEEKIKRKKYKKLLSTNSTQVPTMMSLPPLETFPHLFTYGY